MKHTASILILIIAILTISAGGCSERKNDETDGKAAYDKAANDYYSHIYDDPAATEAGLRELKLKAADEDHAMALEPMIAIARLNQGDLQGCDSIMQTLKDYVRRNPESLAARERLVSGMGVLHSLYGRNDLACDDFLLATEVAKCTGNWDLAVKSLANAGEMTEILGDPAKAVGIFRKALLLADSTGRKGQDFSIRIRLASTFTSMDNFIEADRLFGANEGELAEVAPVDRFYFYSAQGNSHYYREDYAGALKCFLLAQRELPKVGDPYLDAVTHSNLGESYLYTGQLDSARRYITMAAGEIDALAVTDANQTFYFNSLLGELEMRSGNRDKAREYLLAVDADSVSVAPRYKALHHHRLTDYYTSGGDYRNALRHERKAKALDDSVQMLINRNYSAEVTSRYEQDTTLLHTSLRSAQKDEKISRLYMWIFLSVAVAMAIILGLELFHLVRRRRIYRQMDMMMESLVGARLESARNRISPHFIFNLLNTELSGDNQRVRNLVNLMRLNLELCNRQEITIDEEIDFIDLYMEVMKPSVGTDFVYEKDIDPDIDLTKLRLPAMSVQIFVENAIKHGLSGYEAAGKRLWLRVRKAADATVVEVVNTMPAGHRPMATGTGTGLRIVTQAVEALNARNRSQIELSQAVERNPDGGELFISRIEIKD